MKTEDLAIAQKIKSTIISKDPNAEVVLFGSRARGDATIDSDWDILILLNTPQVNLQTQSEFRGLLFDVVLEIEQPISAFVRSKTDWHLNRSYTPLYKNIKSEGIYL